MECIFIEITGTDVGSNGNILVGLLYRPPSQSLVSLELRRVNTTYDKSNS